MVPLGTVLVLALLKIFITNLDEGRESFLIKFGDELNQKGIQMLWGTGLELKRILIN